MRIFQTFFLLAFAACAIAQEVSLTDAIRSGRAKRPAFEAARLRIDQANLSRRALGAFPTTRLSLGYTSDLEVGGSDDDLVVSQPLDIFGRTGALRRSGNALVAQAEASYRQVAADVQSEVVAAYIEASTSRALVRSAEAVEAVYAQLYEATRLRVEGGIAPGFHLTKVSLDLEQAKLTTEQRRSEAAANVEKLAALIGHTEGGLAVGDLPPIETSEVEEALLARQRADLQLLAADVQAAEAEAGIIRLGSMPELELQGRRTPWQERDDRYGLRVQLSIPLFDYGRVRSETKAANVRADAARKALEDATKLATGELRAARIERDAARTQVEKYQGLVVKAKELVDRLRPGLTEQATTLIEVLDSTRVLRDLEEAYVEARARLARAQARYLKATGQILEVTP